MSKVNINSKSILAKLMAAEDVHVTHNPKAKTASFNVKTRELTLPIFKDMNGVIYDGFVSHEIGHALYTPMDELLEAITVKKISKSLLNIVEDARIEKLVKIKFPGCVKMFASFYSKLFAGGFFGHTPVDQMKFIDRINVYFKVGPLSAIQFNKEEQVLVDLVAKTKTYSDVVEVSQLIKEFVKMNKEPMPEMPEEDENALPEMSEYEELEPQEVEVEEDEDAEQSIPDEDADTEDGEAEEEDVPGTGDEVESDEDEDEDNEWDEGCKENDENAEDSDEDDADEVDGDTDITGDADEEVEGDDDSDEYDAEEGDTVDSDGDAGGEGAGDNDNEELTDEELEEELESDTQNEFDEKFEKDAVENNQNNTYEEFHIDHIKNVPENVVTYKEGIAECLEFYDGRQDVVDRIKDEYKNLSNTTKPLVKHLMKIFDQKKSASLYERTRTCKSGVLDTNKMHAYKTVEDIFKRGNVIKKGKNHGFVIVVDFSGSMKEIMLPTMRQLLTLATFCRKANIPLEVYSFTQGKDLKGLNVKPFEEFTFTATNVHMNQLLSASMNKKEFSFMSAMLWNFACQLDNSYYARDFPKKLFNMSGTPLAQAILLTSSIVMDFKKAHNVEICNTIFMTDGCGHGGQMFKAEGEIINRRNAGMYKSYGANAYFNIVDDVTKQATMHVLDSDNNVSFEDVLYQSLKDRTGSSVMTIRLQNPRVPKYTRKRVFEEFGLEFTPAQKAFTKEGYLVAENRYGVDQGFIINTNIMSETKAEMPKHVDATNAKREFNKKAKAMGANRFIFNKMMELLA